MSTEQESAKEQVQPGAEAASEASPAAEAQKLRRRPFGYSKRDVREALDRQSAALGAREAELAELRQDIAALWLAFAQHDRMIRRALGEEREPAAPMPSAQAEGPSPGHPPAARPPAAHDPAAEDEAAIGRQLSDLDDVLAAIELATQTLERTYVDEGRPAAGGEAGAPPAEKPSQP